MNLNELIGEARSQVKEISVAQYIENRFSYEQLIDVREPDEFAAGHLPEAINIPRGVIEMQLCTKPEFNKPNRPMALMCKSGGRSALAVQSLQKLGFNQIVSIKEGYDGYVRLNQEK